MTSMRTRLELVLRFHDLRADTICCDASCLLLWPSLLISSFIAMSFSLYEYFKNQSPQSVHLVMNPIS